MEELLRQIPEAQADQALLLAQAAMIPYMKDSARRKVLDNWRRLARPKVRTVFEKVDDFVGWLARHGVG